MSQPTPQEVIDTTMRGVVIFSGAAMMTVMLMPILLSIAVIYGVK